ncbi:MAG TPA: hypothetical protein VMX14_03810 [Anaerolineae bacterium]|nr:hypothetical protein [Anaerolineae bacterium]HUW11277.1 hypothetical protein [Anaerolineae bacterium]
MIDPHVAIKEFLALQEPFATRVGDRLHAGRSEPPKGYTPADGDCVVFMVRPGGGPDYEDALLVCSVQFKCYGFDALDSPSEVESFGLYRLLYDALHNGHDGTLLWGLTEGVGQLLAEPETDWYFVLAYFTVMLRQ